MQDAIILDLDLTLLKPKMPNGYIHSPENFKANELYYYAHLEKCEPMRPVIHQVFQFLQKFPDTNVIFLTARREPYKGIDTRAKTMETLAPFFERYKCALIMMPETLKCESSVDVAEFKERELKKIQDNFRVLFALDDDVYNRMMYSMNGIPSFSPDEFTAASSIEINLTRVEKQ